MLSEAQTINGLRAVFGEQYPDPVRVVAVGGSSIEAMLASPDSKEWEGYSVEFCGGTHIGNSREVERFALLSEEGLGRGVRRVVGVTGAKAFEAFDLAATMRSRCDAAAKLEGAARDAEVGELTRQLETAVVPAPERKRLAALITDIKKKALEASKGDAKANTEAAKAEAAALAAAHSGGPLVGLLKTEADAKVVDAAVSVVAAALPETAVLLLGKGKTAACLALVPSALEAKLSAKDWLNAALGECGGKGGGKPGRAQGAARDPTNIAAAETKARDFATAALA